MSYKERVLYNGLLFEQIKSLLNVEELKNRKRGNKNE